MTTLAVGFPFLTLLVALPAVAALFLAVIPGLASIARQFALLISLLELALTVFAVLSFDWSHADAWQLGELHSWIAPLGVSWALAANGLALVMVLLAVFLVPLVVIAAWNEQDKFGGEERIKREKGFNAWILLLESFMVLIFVARDVFLFYLCFEAMLVPLYFLIGVYGGPQRKRAAIKFLLYSLFGGLIMLVGVIGLGVVGPGGKYGFLVANLQSAQMSSTTQTLLFVSFFIAFAIKAPVWPLHTWLPDTAEQATPGTSTLLVGVLDKVGTYGMLVLCAPLFPQASKLAAPIIIVFALLSIIIGGLVAVAQQNLLRLVSYTSISHFGFMVMGIYSGSAIAISGAMLYMVAHGVGTAALFLITGMLAKRNDGSYLISSYGGWQRVTPLLAGTWLIAGLAAIALPGLSGFVPEYLTLMGTFTVSKYAAMLAACGVIIAACYILWPYQKVFTGPKPQIQKADLNAREKVVVAPLLAAMFFLGFYPTPVLNAVDAPAKEAAKFLSACDDSADSAEKCATDQKQALGQIGSPSAFTALSTFTTSEGSAL